jgi:serine/threonine protein kinase
MDHPAQIGKYAIEKFLGGGMSNVYRAKDTVLGRHVALKILTAAGAADDEAKTRFLLEARMASNIVHENIISVFDFGEDQGRPFMVMEYLEGESLRSAIRNGRTGDFRNRMRIGLQIARAVDYIHSKKVIHRDVKPENIHIDATGKVKMMDFGIAKADGMQLTRAGYTLGTPYYMAPEQVLGRSLTPQADVYAFGVLMFELLTGTRAIGGDKVEQIFDVILNQPLDIGPLQAEQVPVEVIALTARCTAKQPMQRPPGMAVVADEIERIIAAIGGGVPIPQPIPAPVKPEPFVPGAQLEGLPAWMEKLPPRLRTQGALMAMAGVAMFIGVVVIYLILLAAHVV